LIPRPTPVSGPLLRPNSAGARSFEKETVAAAAQVNAKALAPLNEEEHRLLIGLTRVFGALSRAA
jgi:hypothetical protein